jgi:hypothetical protein
MKKSYIKPETIVIVYDQPSVQLLAGSIGANFQSDPTMAPLFDEEPEFQFEPSITPQFDEDSGALL